MVQLVQGIVDTQKHICRSIGRANAGDDLEIELEVKMNEQPITFINPTCELLIKKPDNNKVRQTNGILYQDGKFKIKVDEQGVTYPGIVTCQLVINDEGRVSTCLFYFTVGTSLDREVLQSISKVETLEQLDEYIVTAFANLEEYEKRILSSDETIRKLNSDINEAEKIRDAAEQKREEFKLLLESKLENGEFIGATGKQGEKGDTGAIGPKGEQGIPGEQGPKGDKGERGERGPQGLTGATGPQGIPGERGPQGEQGPKGERGEKGEQGIQGVAGKDGVTPDMSGFENKINEQYEDIIIKNNKFKQQMNESFGNARTDYFGKEHDNIVERLTNDFDNVHQRINDSNYLEYSGSNIKANNSYYGYTKEMSVKGRTLQNLITKYNEDSKVFNVSNGLITINAGVGSNYRFFSPLNNGMLKPNTKYTIVIDIIENTLNASGVEINYNQLNGDNYGNCIKDSIFLPFGSVGKIVKVVTSKEDVVNQKYLISSRLSPPQTSGILKMYLTILEGDYTNTPIEAIPFIEGIKSVGETDVAEDGKYPVNIKSCGKNLFDVEKFKEISNHTSTTNIATYTRAFPIKLKPNTAYLISIEYDTVTNYLGVINGNGERVNPTTGSKFRKINTTTDGMLYMAIQNITEDKLKVFLTEVTNIQLEEIATSQTTPTPYEPYQETTQEIQLTEPLRSLPNGVCDEITEDGTEIRRIGKVVLDGKNISDYTIEKNLSGKYLVIKYAPIGVITRNSVLCDKLAGYSNSIYTKDYEGVYIIDGLKTKILSSKLETQDLSGVIKYLQVNPITIYYKLDEPIITKHNKKMILKTYAGTTYITSDHYLQPTINCKVPSNVQAVVSGLITENKALNTKVSTLNLENEEIKETNIIQDELINTTMMATDEMYMMLEPLLAETLSERSTSKMVDMYVAMVQRGIKTIEQVPVRYREQVKKILDQLEK